MGEQAKYAPLLDGTLCNVPHSSHFGHRVVGFKVPEEVAGLSDGIFMLESARDALRAFPDLLEALTEACEIIKDLSHFANNNGGMIDDETFAKGLAAIAKATPSQPTAKRGE